MCRCPARGLPRDGSGTVRRTEGSRRWPSRSPPLNPGVTVARCSPGGLEHLRGPQAGSASTLHSSACATSSLPASGGRSLWAVSRTARHSTLSTTANVYARVPQRTAGQAVDAIAAALDQEEQVRDHIASTRPHVP